ncbi:hypothetical protein D3C85_1027560 [compost metagenome]
MAQALVGRGIGHLDPLPGSGDGGAQRAFPGILTIGHAQQRAAPVTIVVRESQHDHWPLAGERRQLDVAVEFRGGQGRADSTKLNSCHRRLLLRTSIGAIVGGSCRTAATAQGRLTGLCYPWSQRGHVGAVPGSNRRGQALGAHRIEKSAACAARTLNYWRGACCGRRIGAD